MYTYERKKEDFNIIEDQSSNISIASDVAN